MDSGEAIRHSSFQHRLRVNVWVRPVDDYVIGAYVIQHRLSGAQYADFLEETLQSL
jgi:hypothetical protein